MSQVSKSHCAKMFELWAVCGVANVLADVAEFVKCVSAKVAGLFAEAASVAFDVGKCTLLSWAGVFAVLPELPQVSSNSRSACSSRSNSSWSGTPCGAYRIIISVMTCAFAVLSKSLRKSLRQSKSVASLMNCNSVFGFCRKTTSLNASGSSAPRNGDSFLFPPLTINETMPLSSVSALTIQLESLYGKR